jgi:hypothetical protein
MTERDEGSVIVESAWHGVDRHVGFVSDVKTELLGVLDKWKLVGEKVGTTIAAGKWPVKGDNSRSITYWIRVPIDDAAARPLVKVEASVGIPGLLRKAAIHNHICRSA